MPFTKQVWINESDMPVNVVDLAQQPDSYLWLCTDAGIYRYNGRLFTRIPDTSAAPATAICASGNSVYIGYNNGHVARVIGKRVVPIKFKNGPVNSNITALRMLYNDILLIATEANGLYVAINGTLIAINTSRGLSDDFISDIAIGKDKILLTTDNGLNILSLKEKRLSIEIFGMQAGLPDVITTCIAPTGDARTFWIGTQKGAVAIYSDDEKKIHVLKPNLPWNFGQINDLFVLNANEAWAITDDDFLVELKRMGDSVIVRPTLMSVKLKRIAKDIAEMQAGNVYRNRACK